MSRGAGHWNYRVVVTVGDAQERDLNICEVHYDPEDHPFAWSQVAPGACQMADEGPAWARGQILADLLLMRGALDRTVLKLEDGELIDTGEMLK